MQLIEVDVPVVGKMVKHFPYLAEGYFIFTNLRYLERETLRDRERDLERETLRDRERALERETLRERP